MSTENILHFPDTFLYSAEHIWMGQRECEVLLGITDYAQRQLAEIVFVDLPAPGTQLKAGQEFGTVESLKSVNALYAPCSGMVTAVNHLLETTPTLVNVAPYTDGWMICIRCDDPPQKVQLMEAAAYRCTVEG